MARAEYLLGLVQKLWIARHDIGPGDAVEKNCLIRRCAAGRLTDCRQFEKQAAGFDEAVKAEQGRTEHAAVVDLARVFALPFLGPGDGRLIIFFAKTLERFQGRIRGNMLSNFRARSERQRDER